MFSIGEHIIYGNQGVYTVSDLSRSPVDKDDERQYYVLRPIHESASNIIFTPVNNDRVPMRLLISRDEALELIDRIPFIGALEIENEKKRRDVYKAALGKTELDEYVRIIKTVYLRRERLAKNRKRVSEADAEYEKRAKYCLYGELAVVLDISMAEVERFIAERIGEAVFVER